MGVERSGHPIARECGDPGGGKMLIGDRPAPTFRAQKKGVAEAARPGVSCVRASFLAEFFTLGPLRKFFGQFLAGF
jgi:hypothetical protein